MKTFLQELSEAALSLQQAGRPLFAGPIRWASLSNGDADFHDNVIFFGFAAQQTEPVLAVKVPRLAENGWMLKTEYDHLMELWRCIGEQAAQYVPRPFALAALQGWPALMISYVAGESLTRLSRRSFWDDQAQVLALATEAARTLRSLNALTESARDADPSTGQSFEKKAERFREQFELDGAEERALQELVDQFREHSRAASRQVIIQGDFWHGNMIRDKVGGRLMLVDWQFARWSVDVSTDVYFFLLAGALSASGHGPAEERAKIAYDLLRGWQAVVIPQYLAAYGRPERYGLLPQRPGMLMCCVEKAVRSAQEFGYSHPDDLLWRHLFGQLVHWPSGDYPPSEG